jgi:F0F1-type ATP synthase gamma subunit
MEQRQKLKEEMVVTKNMKMLTTAYQEHALEQINFARYSVLASREFAVELATIFGDVRHSYQRILEKMVDKDKKRLEDLRKSLKNGKEVLVLVSANNKLYGELIPKICALYIERAKATDSELVVIGKEGRIYVDRAHLNRAYTYFEIPDNEVNIETLKPLTTYLLPFENVLIFCGKFNNVVSQEAIAASITGAAVEADSEKTPEEKAKKDSELFLFEPSIEYVVDFFENQIFSIILSQTISEAQLARYGSRIQAMETAQNNMQRLIEKIVRRQKTVRAMEINKKQLELFAGRRLWGKK